MTLTLLLILFGCAVGATMVFGLYWSWCPVVEPDVRWECPNCGRLHQLAAATLAELDGCLGCGYPTPAWRRRHPWPNWEASVVDHPVTVERMRAAFRRIKFQSPAPPDGGYLTPDDLERLSDTPRQATEAEVAELRRQAMAWEKRAFDLGLPVGAAGEFVDAAGWERLRDEAMRLVTEHERTPLAGGRDA